MNKTSIFGGVLLVLFIMSYIFLFFTVEYAIETIFFTSGIIGCAWLILYQKNDIKSHTETSIAPDAITLKEDIILEKPNVELPKQKVKLPLYMKLRKQ